MRGSVGRAAIAAAPYRSIAVIALFARTSEQVAIGRHSSRHVCPAEDSPKTAIGFDLDGAEASHIGTRVTFEVLHESLGLDRDSGLVRLGSVVNALDVGCAPAVDAAGSAAIMAGFRAQALDDDALLSHASSVRDGTLR